MKGSHNLVGVSPGRHWARAWMAKDLTVGLLVCLPLAVVHIASVQRLVGRGDAAEFVIAAYTLGIPHPPGYPIYTLLGRLFCLLPAGGIAFRVNLMSAVFAVLSLLMIFRLAAVAGRCVSGSRLLVYVGAALAAALVGLSPVFRQYARIAEVYTLSLFLVALACCLMSDWLRSGRAVHLYGLAVALGLALGAHLSTGIIAAAFLLIALLRRVRPSHLLCGVGLAGLCGSQYLYLLIRAGQAPAYLNPNARFFEMMAQTGTDNALRNWLWFVSGGPWRDQYARSLHGLATKARELLSSVNGDHPALLGCAAVGAVLLLVAGRARASGQRRADRVWQWALLAAVAVSQVAYYVVYRASQPGMVLPLMACLAIFAAVGMVAAASLVGGLLPSRLRTAVPVAVAAVAAVGLALPGLSGVAAGRQDGDRAATLIVRTIEQIPPGSTLDGVDWKYGKVIEYYRIVERREITFDCRACDEATIAAGRCFVLGTPKTVRACQRSGYQLDYYLGEPGEPAVYAVRGSRPGTDQGLPRQ